MKRQGFVDCLKCGRIPMIGEVTGNAPCPRCRSNAVVFGWEYPREIDPAALSEIISTPGIQLVPALTLLRGLP